MNSAETILVVDDEPLLRENLRAFLEDIGFHVLEAGQGETALELCTREHPDLVLLDINMPGKNGFEVCRSLKRLPGMEETPVIFLSGLMETRDKLEAFGSGGVDYVGKPFHFEEVEARVRTHLELRRQRRQLEESHRNIQMALADARQANRQLIEVNERLRQSEALKTHFIANMRNEIHDPLGAILGLAGEICDERVPLSQCRTLATLIRREASHLEFELRNIFCAAELEAGEASPTITQVDLGSVLRDAIKDFAEAAQERAQTLRVLAAEGTETFPTDMGMVRIILANLVANAIEFSPHGECIDLRARVQGGELLLEVEDRGPGIRDADRSLIFERFRQLEGGHARAHRGQGLGLAVVKALAELLEGEIVVDSEPGRGSKFTCRLPPGTPAEGTETRAFDGNVFIFDEPREL